MNIHQYRRTAYSWTLIQVYVLPLLRGVWAELTPAGVLFLDIVLCLRANAPGRVQGRCDVYLTQHKARVWRVEREGCVCPTLSTSQC